ncbi:hypothetical protein IWW36_001729 [Coemansia brasiliensis]|uniref:Ornithine decarboxylase antizyme n=1 Tax=Coemansia brasiliensis TaxID=2650707 RepID=A0A9W8LYU5_9FUNG|nr:hypothetical protein IWW36_001729 [Coemansia brasiliensis]
MFSIGGDSNYGSMNAAETNSSDDSKPNSICGGSVRQQQQQQDNSIALQDLSPSRTAVFVGEDDIEPEFGLDDSLYTMDSGYEETYTAEPTGWTSRGMRLAECWVERAESRRQESYYFTMASVGKIEPGGGGSAAGLASGAGRLRANVPRNNSMSSMSSVSRSSAAAPVVPRHNAALADSMQQQLHAKQVHPHSLALKSASNLLSEIFPEGVPSQGVLKSGVSCIQADVRFWAVGCQQPWHAFIVDDVLYMYVSEFSGSESNFRDAIVALMELAEDVLGCSSTIVALPRALNTTAAATTDGSHMQQRKNSSLSLDTDAAASLVRAFMYSGFELVSPMLYCPSSAYILVGYDAM